MDRELGKKMHDGEILFRQGEAADRMYVIKSGKVEVFRVQDGREIKLGELGNDDFFGEMGSIEDSAWRACVRSKGEAQVFTIDQKFFMRKFHEDPSFAFRILVKMSKRIRMLSEELCSLALACHPGEDLWEFVRDRRRSAHERRRSVHDTRSAYDRRSANERRKIA
jgi:CRP/FNR family cyclic AMP-dependent transcriptional regulator